MASLVLGWLEFTHLVGETGVEGSSLEREFRHGRRLGLAMPALPALNTRPRNNSLNRLIMDALRAHIAVQKRKAADSRAGHDKYARRGEICNRYEAENEPEGIDASAEDAVLEVEVQHKDEPPATERQVPRLNADEVSRRLRLKGEPIRMFSETENERVERLREAELREEHGKQNSRTDYLKALEGTETDLALSAGYAQNAPRVREGVGMDQVLDLALLRKDPAKLYPMIYYTLKGLFADWEADLAERPEEMRLSTDGRLHTAAFLQSSQNIKPLYKLLRRRVRA